MAVDAITVPKAEAAAIDRALWSIASPGATLTGLQRRQLAGVVRGCSGFIESGSDAPSIDPTRPSSDVDGLVMLTRRLTTEAQTFRLSDVEDFLEAGGSAETFVEILGLTARIQAIDTFCFGLGLDLPVLPPVIEGTPTGETAGDARLSGGWVPTVGPASPPNALSLVPAEYRGMHDLHGVFYLSVDRMADLNADRGLHRTQMELVAARTSLLNECYF